MPLSLTRQTWACAMFPRWFPRWLNQGAAAMQLQQPQLHGRRRAAAAAVTAAGSVGRDPTAAAQRHRRCGRRQRGQALPHARRSRCSRSDGSTHDAAHNAAGVAHAVGAAVCCVLRGGDAAGSRRLQRVCRQHVSGGDGRSVFASLNVRSELHARLANWTSWGLAQRSQVFSEDITQLQRMTMFILRGYGVRNGGHEVRTAVACFEGSGVQGSA